MANHDNYDNNILRALQKIAKSLESIDASLKAQNSSKDSKNNIVIDKPMKENEF